MKTRIPMASPALGEKEIEYVTAAVKSGWISSLGQYVTEFENKFSKYCGAKYGVTTSSGTTALHLALAVLGIRPSDEVIIPDLTMIATANAVRYTGARPVAVDSESETWNMDATKLEAKITSKTKAIMPVHTYGHPADMDAILESARKHELFVVEDAAEAHGAEYKTRRVGGLGDVGCFSFYANKIITTGEGGMLVTNDEKIAEKARLLKDQAYEKKRRFWHQQVGFNYRLTNLQAALGLAQFERINEFVETRRKNAHLYNSLLADVECLRLPPEAEWAKNVYWMYSILVQEGYGLSRDALIAKLTEAGIESRPFFFPVHLQPAYSDFFNKASYPVAQCLSDTGLNLPSGNTLTEREITRVCETIRSLAKHRGSKQ